MAHPASTRQRLAKWIAAGIVTAANFGCDAGGGRAPATNGEPSPLENPDGNTKASSYLIESVSGLPEKMSNSSFYDIQIKKRNGDSLIQWKLASYDKNECVKERNWSEKTEASQIRLSKSDLRDGDVMACIRAETPDGTRDSNYLQFTWQYDGTIPEGATSAVFTNPSPPTAASLTRTVGLQWVICEDPDGDDGADPSGLMMHRIQVGTNVGGKDVMTKDLGITEYQTSLTLPRDGRFYFSVACPDAAGNEAVTELPYPLDVDTTPPSAPTSATWNRTSPTNQGTGIILSWNAVQDDTAVTYLYKLGSAKGGGTTFNTAATNSVTLNLANGTYYPTIKAKNAAGGESTVFEANTPLIVDTVPPDFSLTSLPSSNVSEALQVAINPISPDMVSYRYKVIPGSGTSDCTSKGSWSDWTSPGVQISDNISGPAYHTSMVICAQGRDTAGNQTADNVPVIHSWNNTQPGGVQPKDEKVKQTIVWSAGGSVKSLSATEKDPVDLSVPYLWPVAPTNIFTADSSSNLAYSSPDLTLIGSTPYVIARKTIGSVSSIIGKTIGGIEESIVSETETNSPYAGSVTRSNSLNWVFHALFASSSSIFRQIFSPWNSPSNVENISNVLALNPWERMKAVTSGDGTIYAGGDALAANGGLRSIIIRQIKNPGGTAPATVTTDFELKGGLSQALDWCHPSDGKAYLLDLVPTPDNFFTVLVSCVSNSLAIQRVKALTWNGATTGDMNTRFEVTPVLETTTVSQVATGSIAYNSSDFLVAYTDPGNRSKLFLCFNPESFDPDLPHTNCYGPEVAGTNILNGSENTIATRLLLTESAEARILIASELSGMIRIGLAEGTAGVNYTLNWLHAEHPSVTKQNFQLAPRLIQLP